MRSTVDLLECVSEHKLLLYGSVAVLASWLVNLLSSRSSFATSSGIAVTSVILSRGGIWTRRLLSSIPPSLFRTCLLETHSLHSRTPWIVLLLHLLHSYSIMPFSLILNWRGLEPPQFPTAIRRCLGIPEILHKIICECGDVQDNVASNKPALLAIALTCTLFMAPALDVLWSDQQGLDNLMRCLPRGPACGKKGEIVRLLL